MLVFLLKGKRGKRIMKMRKIELQLEGDKYWPKVPVVHVAGTVAAQALPEGVSQEEAEAVIRGWDQVAVLRVAPADGRALIGFWTGPNHCQYLNVPVETTDDGLFAMRVGSDDTDFFIIPENHHTNYALELVTVTTLNDPSYETVPVY